MTTKEQAKDRALRKRYGLSLAEYEVILIDQHGLCAICGRAPKARALHVDHDHKYRSVKISAYKDETAMWYASAIYRGLDFAAVNQNRFFAVQKVKQLLKRASVRGLLCWSCNMGLQKFMDNPDRLYGAAEYLRKFAGLPEKPREAIIEISKGDNDEGIDEEQAVGSSDDSGVRVELDRMLDRLAIDIRRISTGSGADPDPDPGHHLPGEGHSGTGAA